MLAGGSIVSTQKSCTQKHLLIAEIRTVIATIAKVHGDELEAVLQGNFSTADYTLRKLADYRELKRSLIERYRIHVASHGC